MDVLKITDKARALLTEKGDDAQDYAQHHLDAAREVGLEGAVRDWQALLEALSHLRGDASA